MSEGDWMNEYLQEWLNNGNVFDYEPDGLDIVGGRVTTSAEVSISQPVDSGIGTASYEKLESESSSATASQALVASSHAIDPALETQVASSQAPLPDQLPALRTSVQESEDGFFSQFQELKTNIEKKKVLKTFDTVISAYQFEEDIRKQMDKSIARQECLNEITIPPIQLPTNKYDNDTDVLPVYKGIQRVGPERININDRFGEEEFNRDPCNMHAYVNGVRVPFADAPPPVQVQEREGPIPFEVLGFQMQPTHILRKG
ncbi:uncharacterized protein LOC117118073 [Anneissia japonica]|uniref:uncharacterized protein LOC117118073 n=1 Tax=Anneissia japonica TaxID=1529436 RepID=UPI0014258A9B|nr:uncharacterized protein LOC117118073 [Anneissia japonica]